jgi:hypothetical protein
MDSNTCVWGTVTDMRALLLCFTDMSYARIPIIGNGQQVWLRGLHDQ